MVVWLFFFSFLFCLTPPAASVDGVNAGKMGEKISLVKAFGEREETAEMLNF